MHNVKSDIVYGYDPTTGYLHTAATTFKVSTPFTETITYGYKSTDGTRLSMSIDGDARVGGHQAFSYLADGYSRIKSITNPFGNTTTWGYDSNGTIATQALNPTATPPTSSTADVLTTYARPPLEGRLMGIGNTSSTGGVSLFNSGAIGYNADDQITGWNSDNLTYNADHRVETDRSTTWYYDDMGNITNALPSGELNGYGGYTRYYDKDNQWKGYVNPADAKKPLNTVNNNPTSTAKLFEYDDAGNPTTYKGDTLTFDFANRLLTYSQYNPTTPATPTPLMNAEYGANGLRAWKKSYGADGMVTLAETYYLYDGDQPIMEFAGDGETCTAINTWGPIGLVSREDNRDGAGMEDIYYLYDPLGNVVQRLNDIGGAVSVRSADTDDAYGNRNTTGTMETVDANDPWGYKAQYGYYTDYETKLILCEHRYYDPFAGHWLTRDPIGSAGGLNLYEYCGGDPVGGVDANGLYKVIDNQGVIWNICPPWADSDNFVIYNNLGEYGSISINHRNIAMYTSDKTYQRGDTNTITDILNTIYGFYWPCWGTGFEYNNDNTYSSASEARNARSQFIANHSNQAYMVAAPNGPSPSSDIPPQPKPSDWVDAGPCYNPPSTVENTLPPIPPGAYSESTTTNCSFIAYSSTITKCGLSGNSLIAQFPPSFGVAYSANYPFDAGHGFHDMWPQETESCLSGVSGGVSLSVPCTPFSVGIQGGSGSPMISTGIGVSNTVKFPVSGNVTYSWENNSWENK